MSSSEICLFLMQSLIMEVYTSCKEARSFFLPKAPLKTFRTSPLTLRHIRRHSSSLREGFRLASSSSAASIQRSAYCTRG